MPTTSTRLLDSAAMKAHFPFRSLGIAVLLSFFPASIASAQVAPTQLYPDPNVYGLITLPGDLFNVRYATGNLERAARIQFRFEPALRVLNRWTDSSVTITAYVLTRKEWDETRIAVPYGLPVRVGRYGIATPANGDDASVKVWHDLRVGLPSSQTASFGATPQHESALVMADLWSQLLICEILVDHLNLAGTEHWVRGLNTHVLATDYFRRQAPEALTELEPIFRAALAARPTKSFAAADYRADLGLADWLWFQANFHYGATRLLEEEGRGALKQLRKLRKRNSGVLTGGAILEEYPDVKAWFYDSFSAVSMRTE